MQSATLDGDIPNGPPRRIPRRVREQEGMRTVLHLKLPHSSKFKSMELGTNNITYVNAFSDTHCSETFWEKYKMECVIQQQKGMTAILWDIQEEKGEPV